MDGTGWSKKDLNKTEQVFYNSYFANVELQCQSIINNDNITWLHSYIMWFLNCGFQVTGSIINLIADCWSRDSWCDKIDFSVGRLADLFDRSRAKVGTGILWILSGRPGTSLERRRITVVAFRLKFWVWKFQDYNSKSTPSTATPSNWKISTTQLQDSIFNWNNDILNVWIFYLNVLYFEI